MSEEHISAREATEKSMSQITGAVIGIAAVLTAVFIPMAFFSGSVGVIYRQFSITIASAMILSALCRHRPDARALRFDAQAARSGQATPH